MAFNYELDEEVEAGVRRIAGERTASALEALGAFDEQRPVETVTTVRERCDEVRALARLVRGSLGKRYRPMNERYRDAARALAGVGRARVLLETFDRVVATAADGLPDGGVGPARIELARRAAADGEPAVDARTQIERATELLVEAEARIDRLVLADDGWSAIADGLTRTYGRGVAALRAGEKTEPAAAAVDEYRKRATYTRHQLRLLEPAAPSVLTPLVERFADLCDGLADAARLAQLEAQLRADPDSFGGGDAVDGATAFLSVQRADLQRRCLGLGARLHGEATEAFAARIGGYWETWQRLGDEEPVGRIGVVSGAGDELDGLTVAQLRDLARRHDLPGRTGQRKDDLVAMLRANGLTAV